MKPRKFKLAVLLLCLFLTGRVSASGNSEKQVQSGQKNDFLAGSVVKSRDWEIDRVKNIEIFSGQVSFRNALYSLKSDSAVYHHDTSKWDLQGNVYCLRNMADNTKIEMTCEKANYMEKDEKANLYASAGLIKTRYTSQDGSVVMTFSKNLTADNPAGILRFWDSFSVVTDSATVVGERGIYTNSTQEFEIMGNKPFAVGKNKDYETYMEGDTIKLKKDSKDIKIYGGVKGMIITDKAGLFYEKLIKHGGRK